jgi:hypothetical protein
MENNLLYIKNFEKDHFYKINYLGLDFWDLLQFALFNFSIKPFDPLGGKAPDNWNPILYYGEMGQFDPYMMNGTQARYSDGIPWTAWPKVNGLERTKLFLESIRRQVFNPNNYKKSVNLVRTLSIKKFMIKDTHFIYTKEIISDNKIIITICNKITKRFKRIHIIDLEKVINILFFKNKHGSLIEKNLKEFHIKNLKKIVLNGSKIKIQDENAHEILVRFEFMQTKLYHFTSA